MKFKRKISMLAAIVMTFTIFATACTDADSETVNTMPTLDSVTTTQATTTTTAETTVPETETEVTTVVTTVATEETEATTTVTVSVETEATTTAAATWTETAMSATMYVTENCYSRVNAIIGSTAVSQYFAGDSVEIVAITDTGYYKLDNGSFIHSDYLSDTKPVTTTVTTTVTTVATTTQTEEVTTTTGKTSNTTYTTSGGDAIETPNYTVSASSKYAYQSLSSTEKQLYNDIVTAVRTLDSVVDVPKGMSSDDVYKVYCIVYNAEPELFWMSGSCSVSTDYIMMAFKTTDRDEIASMQAEIDSAANRIVNQVNTYSSTFSKLKCIYDTVIKLATFSKSEDGYNTSIYNGLTGANLQCAGYAKTVQYLCDLCGIESMVVVGTNSEGSSHAWNVVYCENGYYNLDATWGDPVVSWGTSSYVQYEFFLVPDSWIHNITHYNVNTMIRNSGDKVLLFTPPSCTKEAANYFNAYNLVYSTEDEALEGMKEALATAISSGSTVAEIRVTSESLWNTLLSDSNAVVLQKYAKSLSSSVSKLKRQTSTQNGVLVVHYDVVYE